MITFRGFLAAYEEGRDTDEAADDDERRLPNVAEGDALELVELEPQGHETNPPARYTEATLVRTLEELGIGRPSTYASIIGTILDRGYVFKKGTALVPSFLAFSVVNLLNGHFGRLVDYGFTASMEDDLDRIAAGEEDRNDWLRRFYFGENDGKGLQELVSDLGAIDAREINSMELGNGIVSARRPLRPVPRAGRASARTFPTTSCPTSSPSRRRRSSSHSRPASASSASIRRRDGRSSRGPAATARTSRRWSRRARRTSRRRRRSSSRCRSTPSRSTRRSSSSRCRACSARAPTARR